jgi:hypothetical protein
MAVSRMIDDMQMVRKKCLPVAVQYVRNDTDEAEPPPFTTFPQDFVSRKVQGTLRGVEDTLFKGEGVPLRDPLPEGSANFWSPMPFAVPKLDIESDVPIPASAYDYTLISKFPDVPVEYPYDKGLRAGSRPIEYDMVNEPTGMIFRKGVSRAVRFTPDTINYDEGMKELKEMSKKQF